jgi:subtilisin family serine protease
MRSKPVQIGVVDTGIDISYSGFGGQEFQGIGIKHVGNDYLYDADFHDISGHGTAMAARIYSFCKNAKICAVRIAQKRQDGVVVSVDEQAFAKGIEWCVNQGIRIINTSYSIAKIGKDNLLTHACQKAYDSGAIIVAAYRNREVYDVYPAAFPTVIGVRRRDGLRPGQVSILNEENFDFYAWGTSNSAACAQVSAMIGRIHSIDNRYGLEECFAFLREVSVP